MKRLLVLCSEEVGKRALMVRGDLKEKSGSPPAILTPSQEIAAPSSPPTRLSPTIVSPPSESPAQDLGSMSSDVIGSNCVGAQLSPPCFSATARWDSPAAAKSHSPHESPPETDQKYVSSWSQVLSKSSSPVQSETPHGSPPHSSNYMMPKFSAEEIESMLSDLICPGGMSLVGMESDGLEGFMKTERPLWDSPCQQSPVGAHPDQAASVTNSRELKHIGCPSATSGFNMSPRQLAVSDCMVSSADLSDLARYSAQTEDGWEIPGLDLSVIRQLSPEGQEIQPMPYHLPSSEKWSVATEHQLETGVLLPFPVRSTKIAPFSYAGYSMATDPVWTIRVTDDNLQCASSQLESDVNDPRLSQAPPLTWDWAVGVDFGQAPNLKTDHNLAATTYPRQLEQNTVDSDRHQWKLPTSSLGQQY